MNAKKILALILSLVMIFSLAACSGSVDSGKTDDKKEETKTDSSDNKTEETKEDSSELKNEVVENTAEGITADTIAWYRGASNVYTSAASGTFEDKTPDTLRIGSGNQIIGCDPMNSQDEYPWSKNVYEPLITRNYETGEAEPCLATEWGYDEEGNFNITLRENVKFHDGTILNADDVIFTLQRHANDTSSNIHDACAKINFEKTIVEDDLHLTIVFDAPASSFVSALQTGFAGILSKEFFEEHGEEYDFFEADAGTGAYTVVETVSGISQKFERFDDYWGEAPYYQYVECILYKDYTIGGIDYINGDLDVLCSINNYDTAMRFFNGEIDSTVCYQLAPNRGTVLYMNTNEGPCADENVRRAIAHAVDFNEVYLGAFQGDELGAAGTSVLIEGTKFAIDPGEYEYDPELAKEYLAKAGYSDSNPLTLTLETSDGAVNQSICEIIQYYCSEVGINVECIFEKSAAMTKALNSTSYNYDMICYPLQFRSGHPSEALAGRDAYEKEAGSFASIKGINNEELSKLMTEGSTCLDDARAAEVYGQVQQMFFDNVWSIPLTVSKSVIFCRDYIADGVQFPDGYSVLWKTAKAAG